MAYKLFSTSVLTKLKEMTIGSPSFGSLRSVLGSLRYGYYTAPTSPALRGTRINKDKAREIYYNTNIGLNQGGFLARPIVDGISDYIGTPSLSVGDVNTDALMDKWINEWKKPLWEMYRNSLRDADTWVRIRRPSPSVLDAPGDDEMIELEVIDSDRVTAYYHPATNELIRVEILTLVYIEDTPFNPLNIYATGLRSHGREHEMIEIITPDNYMYYDATTAEYLENYEITNSWQFIGMVQVFNDFDSALHGGMSELEGVYPFFHALHELVQQTRMSHKIHANPKVKFKLDDVLNFLRNNFPDSFVNDKFSGKVSWKDNDVFFMESAEDVSFIEAQMDTPNSVALMEFIIDCICMAAEVTEAVLFRTKAEGSSTSDEYERFKTKIERKRENYESYIRQIVRMALKVIKDAPQRPSVSWPAIELEDLVTEATALNQIVTAAEVANRAGAISLVTYRAKIREFFPTMQADDLEQAQVKKEVELANQEQLDLETKMSAIGGGNGNGSGGPNSASRIKRVRAALPMDATPPSPGN